MKALLISILSVFLWIPTMAAGAEGSPVSTKVVGSPLLSSLRQGGYILYVRHGDTVGEDRPNLNLEDCSTQRNLSEAGRSGAIRLGEAIRELRIPVGTPVWASPFCRTRETAGLAFGENGVRTDPVGIQVYRLNGDLSAEEQQAALKAVTSALETKPSAGTNTVIVAHGFPDGVGLGDIPPLGTVVVMPRGQGNGYEIVDRIGLDNWQSR